MADSAATVAIPAFSGRSRSQGRNVAQQGLQHLRCPLAGLLRQHHAMPRNRDERGLHIFRNHEVASGQIGVGARSLQ